MIMEEEDERCSITMILRFRTLDLVRWRWKKMKDVLELWILNLEPWLWKKNQWWK